MKRIYSAVAVLAMLVMGACENTYKPNDLYVPPPNVESGRGSLILDTGLTVYHQPGDIDDLEIDVPTNETLGRYPEDEPDPEKAGKYIIKGPALSTSKLDSGGFTDVLFLYYPRAIEGEFTLRAQIRITEKAGDSSSKGYFFGAVMGQDNGEDVQFGVSARGAGLLFRTNDTADSNSGGPALRPYFTNEANGWSTGPTRTSDSGTARPEYWLNLRQRSWKQERIVEVVRLNETRKATDDSERNIAYIFRVYDSKSGALLNKSEETETYLGEGGTYVDSNSVYEEIRLGKPVYPAIALLGTSIEVSGITLWDNKEKNGTPLVQTPIGSPAYVPVEGMNIRLSVNGSNPINPPVHSSLPNTSYYNYAAANAGNIVFVPVLDPDYADNTSVEWNVVKWEPDDPNDTVGNLNSMIQLVANTEPRRIWLDVPGPGKALLMVNSRDPSLGENSALETLADWSLEITYVP